jgi:hypothetical protein
MQSTTRDTATYWEKAPVNRESTLTEWSARPLALFKGFGEWMR